jgi:hypothetical protein
MYDPSSVAKLFRDEMIIKIDIQINQREEIPPVSLVQYKRGKPNNVQTMCARSLPDISFISHALPLAVLRSVVRWQEYWRLREGQSCLSITDSTILYCTILYCTVPPGRLYVCFHVCNLSVIMCATILLDGDTIVKNS